MTDTFCACLFAMRVTLHILLRFTTTLVDSFAKGNSACEVKGDAHLKTNANEQIQECRVVKTFEKIPFIYNRKTSIFLDRLSNDYCRNTLD